MRLRGRMSVRARAALGAAAAAVAAFSAATYWVGEAAYDQWLPNAEAKALREADLMDSSMTTPHDEPVEPWNDWDDRLVHGGYQQAAYVIVLADGSWARSDRIHRPDASAESFLPPLPQDRPYGFAEVVEVRLPEHVTYDIGTPVGPNPTDRTVTFLRRIGRKVTPEQIAWLSGRTGVPDQSMTTYVMVNPIEAKAARARVRSILGWYVVPGGSLFVALVAWAVTGLALRPVEAIRGRMARIGAGAFHQRVPVPAARDEIAALAVTTNLTLDRLEHALDEQRRLVADAAHELRTPVAVLLSTLEVALAHPDRADWRAVAERAHTDTTRLHRLTEDLLLLHRSEEQPAGPATVEWHDLVGEQLAERAFGGERRIRTGPLEPATVPGTEPLLGRVVGNLLDNAVRHAADAITVSLRTVDGRAVLTVADDGPGIPAADRERVFERFVRLDEARSRTDGGAGLGLSLVRGIVEGLGGSAEAVEPSAGAGAELVVRLPLDPSDPGQSDDHRYTVTPPPAATSR
ncbi:sensor histidine kinase [Kitasatospora cineracea]|uniref:sensor histidine kinase n=1 Tax=Kitasatospora cineracea TaxID=88074 RepID=UPI0036DB63D5